MKFTVVIEDWLRGRDEGALLDEHGQMCCLGFASEQCGVPFDVLETRDYPSNIPYPYRNKVKGILVTGDGFDNEFSSQAAEINDDPEITDKERMERLQELAVKHGHEFEFVHKK